VNAPDHPRSLRHIKSLWWLLFFAGAGTLLFFLVIVMQNGWREVSRDSMAIVLPVLAVILTAVSAVGLRICYKREPANFSGFWHLTLADLIVTAFFSGMVMSVFQFIWPEYFVPSGVFVSILTAVVFAVCLMLATRRGCASAAWRIPCALGYLLWIMGWLLTGLLAVIIAYQIVAERGLVRMIELIGTILLMRKDDRDDEWILNVFRFGFCAIPAGYVLRSWAQRHASRDETNTALK